jgi:hypothetical protein
MDWTNVLFIIAFGGIEKGSDRKQKRESSRNEKRSAKTTKFGKGICGADKKAMEAKGSYNGIV